MEKFTFNEGVEYDTLVVEPYLTSDECINAPDGVSKDIWNEVCDWYHDYTVEAVPPVLAEEESALRVRWDGDTVGISTLDWSDDLIAKLTANGYSEEQGWEMVEEIFDIAQDRGLPALILIVKELE